MPSKYVTVGDDAIHLLHTGPTSLPGEPPPLDRGRLFVFVHAAGRNAGDWRPQLEALAGAHSAVAIDLPGHGRSSGVVGPGSVEGCAALLLAVLDALSLGPVVLVGRCLGGAIAMVASARAPERVAGLVLVGAAARIHVAPEAAEALRDVVRGRTPQQFTTDAFAPGTSMEVMKVAWTEQVRTDPRVALADLDLCADFDAGPLLAAIATPTLVITGAQDALTSVEQGRALAEGIPGARFEILEGAGHHAPLEQSEAFNTALVSFAETLA